MKNYRTVFLPLLLCGVILLSGYFSPLFFNLFTPDPRNKVESVSISTEDSPMYLESTDEVIIPPWDDIDMNQAEHLLETFAVTADEQDALSKHIEADIEVLFPDIITTAALQDNDMTDALLIHEYNLLFLKDHSCSLRFEDSAEDTPYMLDYVLDRWNIFPISLHLRGEKTLPVTDESELRNNLEQLISKFKHDFWKKDIDSVGSLKSIYAGKYTIPLTEAFVGLLSQHNSPSQIVWRSILLNCQEIYTLTYKNETLLVMVDKQNLISCLFFDALTNRVTGYSIDPQLISIFLDSTRISP